MRAVQLFSLVIFMSVSALASHAFAGDSDLTAGCFAEGDASNMAGSDCATAKLESLKSDLSAAIQARRSVIMSEPDSARKLDALEANARDWDQKLEEETCPAIGEDRTNFARVTCEMNAVSARIKSIRAQK